MNDSTISLEADPQVAERGNSSPKHIGVVGAIAILLIVILIYAFVRPYARVLTLFAAITIAVPTHLLGFVLAGWLAGLRIVRITVFYCGALLRVEWHSTWLSIGWLPLGGYVKFAGQEEVSAQDLITERGNWSAAHPLVRILVPLAGPMILILLGMALLGLSAGWGSILRTPKQLYEVLKYAQVNKSLVDFIHFIDVAPFQEVLGLVAVKLAAFNLLPLTVVNGGQSLIELIQWIVGKPPSRVKQTIDLLSLLILLTLFAAVTYGFCVAWHSANTT